jgi:hypothetical protein
VKKFNQKEYIKQYRKTHKVQLNIELNPEEKIELINLIKANGFKSTREFLLKTIDIMKSDKNPFSKN